MQVRGIFGIIGRVLILFGVFIIVNIMARIIYATTMINHSDETFVSNFWRMNFDTLQG